MDTPNRSKTSGRMALERTRPGVASAGGSGPRRGAPGGVGLGGGGVRTRGQAGQERLRFRGVLAPRDPGCRRGHVTQKLVNLCIMNTMECAQFLKDLVPLLAARVAEHLPACHHRVGDPAEVLGDPHVADARVDFLGLPSAGMRNCWVVRGWTIRVSKPAAAKVRWIGR